MAVADWSLNRAKADTSVERGVGTRSTQGSTGNPGLEEGVAGPGGGEGAMLEAMAEPSPEGKRSIGTEGRERVRIHLAKLEVEPRHPVGECGKRGRGPGS